MRIAGVGLEMDVISILVALNFKLLKMAVETCRQICSRHYPRKKLIGSMQHLSKDNFSLYYTTFSFNFVSFKLST